MDKSPRSPTISASSCIRNSAIDKLLLMCSSFQQEFRPLLYVSISINQMTIAHQWFHFTFSFHRVRVICLIPAMEGNVSPCTKLMHTSACVHLDFLDPTVRRRVSIRSFVLVFLTSDCYLIIFVSCDWFSDNLSGFIIARQVFLFFCELLCLCFVGRQILANYSGARTWKINVFLYYYRYEKF